MSDLAPCKRCGSPAAEHIRGEFHAGDTAVELESGLDDYRVACSKFPDCPVNGGWCTPTLKEVAAAKVRWNKMNEI